MHIWFFIAFIGFVCSEHIAIDDKLSREEVGAFIDRIAIPGVAKGAEFIRQNVRGDILLYLVKGDSINKDNAELFKSLGIHEKVVQGALRRRVFEEQQLIRDAEFRASLKAKLSRDKQAPKEHILDVVRPTGAVQVALTPEEADKAPLARVLAFIRSCGVDPNLIGTEIVQIRAEARRLAEIAERERPAENDDDDDHEEF